MEVELIVQREGENSEALSTLLSLIPKNTYFTHYFTRSRVISRELTKPSDAKQGIYLACQVDDPQRFYRELSNNGFTLVASRISR